MMHNSWSSMEEVPYCFSMSSVKLQGHTTKKNPSILTQIRRFRTVTPVWIHQWLGNDAQSLKLHRRGALLYFGVIHQISRSHGLKNRRFEFSLSKITRPVAAIKSLRFVFFSFNHMDIKGLVSLKCQYLSYPRSDVMAGRRVPEKYRTICSGDAYWWQKLR